jgi:hypothetical protein
VIPFAQSSEAEHIKLHHCGVPRAWLSHKEKKEYRPTNQGTGFLSIWEGSGLWVHNSGDLGPQWLTPVILVTWEAEIGRLTILV